MSQHDLVSIFRTPARNGAATAAEGSVDPAGRTASKRVMAHGAQYDNGRALCAQARNRMLVVRVHDQDVFGRSRSSVW